MALIVVLIILAEAIEFSGNPEDATATVIYGLSLIAAAFMEIKTRDRVFSALALMPLFKLIDNSIPTFWHHSLYSYPLAYIVMAVPMFLLIRKGWLSRDERGITTKSAIYLIPFGLFVGSLLGVIEYQMIGLRIYEYLSLSKGLEPLLVIVILLSSLVEEFIFRYAIQTALVEKLGQIMGVILASILYGMTYSIYGSIPEIIFGLFSGLVLGLIFQRTKSLAMVFAVHSFANIILIIVLPNIFHLAT